MSKEDKHSRYGSLSGEKAAMVEMMSAMLNADLVEMEIIVAEKDHKTIAGYIDNLTPEGIFLTPRDTVGLKIKKYPLVAYENIRSMKIYEGTAELH